MEFALPGECLRAVRHTVFAQQRATARNVSASGSSSRASPSGVRRPLERIAAFSPCG
jgi:hypothetical protein